MGMIVYKITNRITGAQYIGQTVKTIKKRWIHHCTPKSTCRYLASAIKKYGSDNFEVTVLTRCNSLEEMNHREQYYIKLFNTLAPNGYNLTTGGGNSRPTQEVIDRRRKSIIGPKHPFFGKHLSAEHRRKISATRIGKKPIICHETGKTYPSIKEAAKALNAFPQHISRVLNGQRKTTRGLSFSYV